MKTVLRKLVPQAGIDLYRKLRRSQERRSNSRKTTEQVFTEIYQSNAWGGKQGEFSSGGGTRTPKIAKGYLECLRNLAEKQNFQQLTAVDLGCGDMHIGRHLIELFDSYVGVDIVKDLIEDHRKNFKSSKVTFHHLNIIDDDLPDGDVCFLRQVLQHLSNDQILRVLQKVKKYRYVIITEHLPTANPGLRKNLDKPHGGDDRAYDNSGVYLDAPPFNLPSEQLDVIYEVEGHGYDNYHESWIKGVIQTVLYTPGHSR
jgi:hypothetical protein